MHRLINRRFVAIAALAAVFALAGATGADAQLERVIDPDWTLPRTADGQPDLQGLWGNKTITPMERPADLEGRAFLTDEEIAQRNRQRALDEAARDAAPARRYEAGGNVGGYGSYWLDAGDTVLSTGQTSLIVDPPDGRAPVRQWALRNKAYNLAHNGNHYRNMSVWDRCLSRGVPGSMLPAGYNNAYRFLQTPDHFVIQHEMIHDARIIPFRDQPFVDDNIRQWMGDARAHWEGDTLVVETKNFHNRGLDRLERRRRPAQGHRRQQGAARRGALPARVGEHHHLDGDHRGSQRLHASLDDPDAADGRAGVRHLRVRLPRGELRGAERAERPAGHRRACGGDRKPVIGAPLGREERHLPRAGLRRRSWVPPVFFRHQPPSLSTTPGTDLRGRPHRTAPTTSRSRLSARRW